jgi:hypothetical protein
MKENQEEVCAALLVDIWHGIRSTAHVHKSLSSTQYVLLVALWLSLGATIAHGQVVHFYQHPAQDGAGAKLLRAWRCSIGAEHAARHDTRRRRATFFGSLANFLKYLPE